ncbi:hypothetical protein DDE74_31570 [Streptomyces lydicus]|uniref:Uncharacterized protein n=1 Tax=Streptomyces lydicus TaxID=47763 RepID=A0A3Q9K9G1_9ACTN|nr:hypothetical protein [Streptomyces lydicus]AZS74867.1 hypothetical protein DDE74_31570 [Streptomyces lydicus]
MFNEHPVYLDHATHTDITLLAGAWDIIPGDAVRRLVESFKQRSAPFAHEAQHDDGAVAVHAIYDQVRIRGRFHPSTRRLVITDGPGIGSDKSPSGATTAVLQALRPWVVPNRSGWTFWIIDSTGERLKTGA